MLQQIWAIRNRRHDADSGSAVCSAQSAALAAQQWAEPSILLPAAARGSIRARDAFPGGHSNTSHAVPVSAGPQRVTALVGCSSFSTCCK